MVVSEREFFFVELKKYMKEIYTVSPEVEGAWRSIELRSQDTPVSGGMVRDRLARAFWTGKPLTLFSPWGVRPEGNFGNAEAAALSWVQLTAEQLREYGIPNEVLIMPADVYATEINGFDDGLVDQYFNAVTEAATAQGFGVKPWSEIRTENQERYEEIKYWSASPQILWRTFPKSLWYRDLLPAAFRRNTSENEQEIKASAFAYLQERVVEAQLIDEVYSPVKVSLVSREKDVPDGNLPRIYVIPRPNRFPWLSRTMKGEIYEE